jgi:GntR family transcriptional regulator/MocR family aminotransferase
VLADFIAEGHFARHIRRMRVLYGERAGVLLDCIKNELAGMVEVFGGEAGMHLTVTLKREIRDREIAESAARQKFWLWPLSPSYSGARVRPGFILGFGSTEVADIPRAVRNFRSLLA